MSEPKTPSKPPSASGKDIAAAFAEGLRKAAEESAKLPKKFKKGEGIEMPMPD